MQFRFARVVDRPQDAGRALRAREPAGFDDLRILEAPRDLEMQRRRLLRSGAAGEQQ
ncbi:MAG: hypothetical protein HKN65_09205 [Woeseiaceae bacterium]|nr:hypothetical protein [Gammaproteobacteria bacterium]NNF50023.1 hypothetical protein [Woeseiaceae bacterium]NNK26457.1 hypothetical protein [Woeseiaceae bacterium]